MTQEELGITPIGMRYIQSIIKRGAVEDKRAEYRRYYQRIGFDNIYDKELVKAEQEEQSCRESSREEYRRIMRERGIEVYEDAKEEEE